MHNITEFQDRFHTQMVLQSFGVEGQQKLWDTKILVIGIGGLGNPCVQYLSAAGIGTIGLCDGDIITLSNLQRQILFAENNIGDKKVTIATQRINEINKKIIVKKFDQYLDNSLALKIFQDFDIIIDCTDDMNTKLLINDCCILLNKPLIYAAVFKYEAQIAVFNVDRNQINLRDLFDEINNNEIKPCNETGVLGAVTGLVGTIQALEAIKLVLKKNYLSNELLSCNFLNYQFYKTTIFKNNTQNLMQKSKDAFLNKDYSQTCKNKELQLVDLNKEAFLQKIKNEKVQVIDVRNKNEKPIIDYFQNENIPLDILLKHPEKVEKEKTILLFCHAGIRSEIALHFLTDQCKIANVYHLKGGIISWHKNEL